MIDTIKCWIEKIKSSVIAKPFITIKRWFQDNVIKRKLVIFSMLFTAWVSLLLGAIYSHKDKLIQMSNSKQSEHLRMVQEKLDYLVKVILLKQALLFFNLKLRIPPLQLIEVLIPNVLNGIYTHRIRQLIPLWKSCQL